MSIFELFKKSVARTSKKSISGEEIQRELYEKNIRGYRDYKDKLDYQNNLLQGVNKAQSQYKQDGDLDAVIKALEFAFVESDPPCESSQNMDLVNYYIKAGRNNDAWGYLNKLILTSPGQLRDIRFFQARILKKEKKWTDAIQMYMLGYLAKSQWNNTFQADMFIKDITSSANKLDWNTDTISKLSQMVERQVRKRNYKEDDLIKEYRVFYQQLKDQ